MKLAISNLAFTEDLDAAKSALLFAAGIRGIEVAPTRLGEWGSLTEACLLEFRNLVEGAGLKIPSLQAILFNVPDAHLLKEEAQFQVMLGHIRRVTAIAATLGAEVLVFGAPKQRTKGDLTEEAAFLLGVRRLGILAQACADKGVTLGLEPVPAAYGGDFLPTWQDVQRMVDAVASSHIAVHLDTACIKLGGGDIGEAIASTQSSLKHFHIAEPQLGNFANPLEEHTIAAAALHKAGYNGWLAIEMLGKTDAAWGDTLESIAFSRRCYGDN